MKSLKFTVVILIITLASLSSCSNLKKGEIAKVDYSFSGCFASGKSELILYHESGSTFVKLETDGKKMQVAKLTKKQIEAFEVFVDELHKLKEENGCTTVEEYKLHTKNGTIQLTDGGCDWDGFSHLKKVLFRPETSN